MVDSLKPREREIVNLLLMGKSNKDICAELNVNRNAIDCSLYQMKKRLGLKSTREIIALQTLKGERAC